MPHLASTEYVKLRTRREYGTANFRGTQRVRVTFAKPFVRRPHVIPAEGRAKNITITGFVLELAAPDTVDVGWEARAADVEEDED